MNRLLPLATLLAVVAASAPTASAQNPSPSEIAVFADDLSVRYRVPAVLIKAAMEQESGWRQFTATGSPVINNEPDGRIGIGLMQVTVPDQRTAHLEQATIIPYQPQGANDFSTTAAREPVDVERLKGDWRYNLEVGVRHLVAKRVSANDADLDARVLETWYYALLYYNGAAAANDPAGPHSRTVSQPGDWKHPSQFPYQESVFNIVAQLYPIPEERRRFYGPPIHVTLPGPRAVEAGAGRYRFVEPTFCLYDWADFHADGTAEIGGGCSQDKMLGCITECKRHVGLTVHMVEFGSPDDPGFPQEVEPFLSVPISGVPDIRGASISAVQDHHIPSGTGYNCRSCNGSGRNECGGSEELYRVLAFEGTAVDRNDKMAGGINSCPEGYARMIGGEFSFDGWFNYTGSAGPAHLDYDGHSGYDFAYRRGHPIIAAAPGRLTIPSRDVINNFGGGSPSRYNSLKIIHDNGYETWYLHASEGSECRPTGAFDCSNGRPQAGASVSVARGQQIGQVGNTGLGCAQDRCNHLHFEVRIGSDQIVDPFGCAPEVANLDPRGCGPRLWLPVTRVPTSSPPRVTSVSPGTLQGRPLPETQRIRISGSGFTPGARLRFSNSTGDCSPCEGVRPPTYISENMLTYDVAVGTQAASWQVYVVVNGRVSSPPGTFDVTRPPRSQAYYGVEVDGDDIAFLLDISGSMEGRDEGVIPSEPANRLLDELEQRAGGVLGDLGRRVIGRARSETTKLGAARRELIRALNGIDSNANFTIITFGQSVQEWPGGYKPIGGSTRRRAQLYVAQLSAHGATPMSAALQVAYSKPNVNAIFIVSDGKPTDGGTTSILNRVARWDQGRNVVINTIGIGPDQDENLLCALARRTGGMYIRDGVVSCR